MSEIFVKQTWQIKVLVCNILSTENSLLQFWLFQQLKQNG